MRWERATDTELLLVCLGRQSPALVLQEKGFAPRSWETTGSIPEKQWYVLPKEPQVRRWTPPSCSWQHTQCWSWAALSTNKVALGCREGKQEHRQGVGTDSSMQLQKGALQDPASAQQEQHTCIGAGPGVKAASALAPLPWGAMPTSG